MRKLLNLRKDYQSYLLTFLRIFSLIGVKDRASLNPMADFAGRNSFTENDEISLVKIRGLLCYSTVSPFILTVLLLLKRSPLVKQYRPIAFKAVKQTVPIAASFQGGLFILQGSVF
ncbi:MAG: hypothetical protein IJ752_09645 [Alphaproteobacteria bacterium]|nr:hypothetical protein [Alphaproteobacteria bacterium]